jgi:hypothetical protein
METFAYFAAWAAALLPMVFAVGAVMTDEALHG